MNNKDYSPLETIISNKYTYPLALAFGYTAAFYSLLDPIINAYKSGDYLRSTVYIVFFLFALFVGYLLRRKHIRTQPPQKGIFQGIGKLSSEDAWPRNDEKNKLCDTIQQSIEKPIIFVGSSGVGKTILLETQVVPSLEKGGWKIIYFSNYDSFQGLLLESLTKIFPDISHKQFLDNAAIEGKGLNDDVQLLLIFDQFEQFLSANSENEGESKKIREWFRALLKNSIKFAKIRYLIVVRKEWYYDLRFLAEFVPPPIESFYFTGLKVEEGTSGRLIMSNRIKTVTKNPSLAEAVLISLIRKDEILPVEAQIVGLMLENKTREIGEIDQEYYLRELGGKDGLIQSYFRAYLDSSPDREISLQVLFALSVETMLRSQLSLSQITDIIHESKTVVFNCLSFLVEQGLVLETKTGQYELAHDYLAEKFHDLSGAELDPVERDNILFFWDEMRRSPQPLDITRPKTGTDKGLVFSDYFMIFLAILLVARLTGPIYNVDWGWFNPLINYQTKRIGIDIYYLPVFISHLAWSIYVTLFYRRLFSHLRESTLWSFFSKFTVINCTACVVTAIFLPHFWLLSIGVGGLAIGLKLYQLSKTPGLGKISIAFFRSTGIKTVINLLIVIALGMSVVYYINTTTLSNTLIEQLNVAFFLLAMFMTYYMLAVTPIHITKNATSKMMGLIDRGRVRLQRLSFELSK